MDITFNIPHAFSPDSPLEENSDVLRILLDCMVQLDLAYLRDHPTTALYQNRVVYGRTNLWEPVPAVIARGFGDCKSLAPWLIAEYMLRGIPCTPVFRFVYREDGSGDLDFHILVQRLDTGAFEDPSRKKGMGRNETAPIPEGRR